MGRKVTNDADRIITALSYLTEGKAAVFAETYLDEVASSSHQTVTETWPSFKAQMDEQFSDKHAANKAREQLENFAQGKKEIDVWVAEFETLLQRAGLSEEKEKIRLLERNVRRPIIERVYGQDTFPTTYDKYRDSIKIKGRLMEQFAQRMEIEGRNRPSFPSHQPSSSSTTSLSHRPTPPVTIEKRTPTGTVYGGQGKPMDIGKVKSNRKDGNCYNCGKPGHFGRDCPDPRHQFNIRAFLQEFSDEELESLKKEMDSPSKDLDDEAEPINSDFLEEP
jgi:hypothetical protein